jgi:putative FmdB family regulatory protein
VGGGPYGAGPPTMPLPMPTYVYRCAKCELEFDVFQSFSDKELTTHDDCGGDLKKIFLPAPIVFKGSGFYKTDSRSGGSSDDD